MHDRDEDEPAAPAATGQQEVLAQMETVAFHLTELYQRLSRDRDGWAVTGGDLAQAAQELRKHIQSFSAVEENVRQRLAKLIREETRQAAVTVGESLRNGTREILAQEIGAASEKLTSTVNGAQNVLETYRQAVTGIRGIAAFMIAASFVGGIMGGGVVAYGTRDAVQQTIQNAIAAAQEQQSTHATVPRAQRHRE